MNVRSIGGISIDCHIADAGDLMGDAKEVPSVIRTGPFVQMSVLDPFAGCQYRRYFNRVACERSMLP
jgi:hypothetical protein